MLTEAQTKTQIITDKIKSMIVIMSNIKWNETLNGHVVEHRGIKAIDRVPKYVSQAWANLHWWIDHNDFLINDIGIKGRRINREISEDLEKIENWMRVTNGQNKDGKEFALYDLYRNKEAIDKLKKLNMEMAAAYLKPMDESMNLKSFKTFLKEGFTHSTHLEDLVIDMGVDGTRAAINALRDFRDAFGSTNNKKELNLSVKWDGAPAVIFGTDPKTKKFFVGTKGVFAKNPKINYTHEDIDANHSGELAKKLHDALDYLPKITPKGRIFQGDYMFSKSDLGTTTINGEKNYTMHPNTIVYTVPVNSTLGKQISSAKMGIVVHTEYTGSDISTMTPTFGIGVDNFGSSKDVWLQGALYHSDAGVGNLTAAETEAFDQLLSDAGHLFKSVSSKTFQMLSTDAELNSLVNIFANSKVRSGKSMDPSTHAHELKDWIEAKYQKDIAEKKTDKSKDALKAKLAEIHSKIDVNELTNIFMLQSKIAAGKLLVINKLNEIKQIGTFVKTSNGEFKVTNHEGFVGISGDMAGVKLVDRLEFSHNNFSKNIIKGWDSATRG